MDITAQLAERIHQTSYEALPHEAIHAAKRCFLDWMGVTLLGSRSQLTAYLLAVARATSSAPQATIIGQRARTDMLFASLINGSASHAQDFDDVHMGTVMHPSAPLIPALLALSERNAYTGRAVLEAFIAGYETEARVAMATGQQHYARGWHSTATMGRIGAAAACAKLLKLSQPQTVCALGLAATQASGLRRVFGSMAKPFHAGKAAADGLLAALLAREGFTCPGDTLEGKFGFFDVLGEQDRCPAQAVEGFGQPWQVLETTFKLHASCTLTHPAIDSALEIRRQLSGGPDQIARILCLVPHYTMDAAGQLEPQNSLQAKFSVYYCVALALAVGETGEEQFEDAVVQRSDLVRLRRKVHTEVVPLFGVTESEVRVETVGGRRLAVHTTTPKGDPRNPVPDNELAYKFRGLATRVLPGSRVASLEKAIWSLETLEDASRLAALTRPRPARLPVRFRSADRAA
jgi:2-methylcitrate dehydratase PrpD